MDLCNNPDQLSWAQQSQCRGCCCSNYKTSNFLFHSQDDLCRLCVFLIFISLSPPGPDPPWLSAQPVLSNSGWIQFTLLHDTTPSSSSLKSVSALTVCLYVLIVSFNPLCLLCHFFIFQLSTLSRFFVSLSAFLVTLLCLFFQTFSCFRHRPS